MLYRQHNSSTFGQVTLRTDRKLCHGNDLSLGSSCFSHLLQVDALARGVWPSDDFDSAMGVQALVTVGHKHRGAELQQRMPGTLEHWWIITAGRFCIQGLLVGDLQLIRREIYLHSPPTCESWAQPLNYKHLYTESSLHSLCELLPPALSDWYYPVARQFGRSVAVLLRGAAHSHQTVQLGNEIQNLHSVHIYHTGKPEESSEAAVSRECVY